MNRYLKKLSMAVVAICCSLSVQFSVSALPSLGDLGNVEDMQNWISNLFTTTTEPDNMTATKSEATTRTDAVATGTTLAESIVVPDMDTETMLTGDVNNDGKITASDARLVLRHSAGIVLLCGNALYVADANGDGVITAKDARSVLRFAAGITKSF